MLKNHLHINKVFVSGENQDLPGLMQDYRAGVVKGLEKAGVQLMPHPKTKAGKSNLLEDIDGQSIHKADAYVFVGRPDPLALYLLYYVVDQAQCRLPDAMLKDRQGKMLLDKKGDATLKPIVILNSHGEYDAFLHRCKDLQTHGAAKKKLEEVAHVVKKHEEIAVILQGKGIKMHPLYVPQEEEKDRHHEEPKDWRDEKPRVFICCGFSLKGDYFEESARKTAEMLAPHYHITTGGGRGGLMAAVQLGAHDAGGHVSCVSFKKLSPLQPKKAYPGYGMSHYREAEGMSQRITEMTKESDLTLILPGGFGTDTEAIASALLRKLKAREHTGHPIVIQNLINPALMDADSNTFPRIHDSLIALLKKAKFKEGEDFVVVEPDLAFDRQGKLDVKASAEKAAEMTVTALQKQSRGAGRAARR